MEYNELYHIGVGHDENPPGRGSGRYEYGSGDNPEQHQFTLRSEVNRLVKDGYSKKDIAKMLLGQKGIDKQGNPIYYNTTDLRAQISIERTRERQMLRAKALELYEECDGSPTKIGRKMGLTESTVRSLLNESIAEKTDKYQNTADFLKKQIEEKGIIDISSDSELYMGTTAYTKNVAVSILEEQGYIKTYVKYPQMGTNNETTVMVLTAPPKEGETVKDVLRYVQQNKYNVKPIQEFTPDEGKTWWTPEFPESLDSKRIKINYAEDGGKEKDGVIELRRGVEDISLGGTQYAQVRIAVDGTNYMKGMAMYSDDIPDGYDVVYNTNKHRGVPAIDKTAVYDPVTDTWSGKEVLKRMKINKETGEVDQDNPFGALIKSPKDRDGVITAGGQRHYKDEDGNDKLSVINKLQDEGDWDSWSRTLSSQFLSKQPEKLIKQQLDLSIADKEVEYERVHNLTNSVIRKKMLYDYADTCDSVASELTAKGFKHQAFQVILPDPKIKETEVYAPNYDDGDTVALVRYPHAGTFEIPILKVNNKIPSAKKDLQNAKDAIKINAKVAERLSGADFDGDTVIVIPMKSNRLAIQSTPSLKGLKDFDPKELYKLPDDAPKINNRTKQIEMGKVTNLITDMTVNGAPFSDIEKAVRHSMVVIDSEKHHLDYKQSEKDNDIQNLKKKYQGVNSKTGQPAGASTILSKASSKVDYPLRKEVTDVKKMSPEQVKRWNEGKKVYVFTGETKLKQIKNPDVMTESELKIYNAGKKVYRKTNELRTTKVARMDLVDDAMDLVRDPSNQKEVLYARYANDLKALANKARKEARSIETYHVSQEAKITYAKEVESLNNKLRNAKLNNPKERTAQGLANAMVSEKRKSNPDLDYEHLKREQALALTRARAMVGAKKDRIDITDREWEAIQARAISANRLESILNNTDQEKLKKRATPRHESSLSDVEMAKVRAMYASGMYTNKEIADSLGVSTSTVSRYLN